MRLLALALLLIIAPGCRGDGHHAAPDGREFPHVTAAIDRHAPPMPVLEGFTYTLPDLGAVALAGGVWRRDATAGESAAEARLRTDFRLTGDITGNGTDEAIVLLTVRRRPAPDRTYLAVVGWVGGQLLNLGSVALDEGVSVTSGRIESSRIVLEGARALVDAAATPQPATLTYVLEANALRLIADAGQ